MPTSRGRAQCRGAWESVAQHPGARATRLNPTDTPRDVSLLSLFSLSLFLSHSCATEIDTRPAVREVRARPIRSSRCEREETTVAKCPRTLLLLVAACRAHSGSLSLSLSLSLSRQDRYLENFISMIRRAHERERERERTPFHAPPLASAFSSSLFFVASPFWLLRFITVAFFIIFCARLSQSLSFGGFACRRDV